MNPTNPLGKCAWEFNWGSNRKTRRRYECSSESDESDEEPEQSYAIPDGWGPMRHGHVHAWNPQTGEILMDAIKESTTLE